MKHTTWMERDERTPEQIRRDRLSHLQHEESELARRLERVRADIAAMTSGERGE